MNDLDEIDVVTAAMLEKLRSFGVATGEFARRIFAKHGIITVGFVWDYRPSIVRESFIPHRQLHGEHVSGLDDAKLSNPNRWPPTGFYYPGDHQSCRCRLRGRMMRQ